MNKDRFKQIVKNMEELSDDAVYDAVTFFNDSLLVRGEDIGGFLELKKYEIEWFKRKYASTHSHLGEKKESRDIHITAMKKYIRLYERCKVKNVEFGLTVGDIKKMLLRKRCSMTNDIISYSYIDGHPHKLTFDRIDSTKGYTRDNVVVCAYWVNSLKNDLFETDTSQFSFNKNDVNKMLKMFNYLKGKVE